MSIGYRQLIKWGTLREFVSLTENTAESGRPWFDENARDSEKNLLATFKLLKESRIVLNQVPGASKPKTALCPIINPMNCSHKIHHGLEQLR